MAGEKSRRAEGREALNCGENGGGGLRERELWGVGGRGMKKDVGKCWWDRDMVKGSERDGDNIGLNLVKLE